MKDKCAACNEVIGNHTWVGLGDGSLIHYGGTYSDRCFRSLLELRKKQREKTKKETGEDPLYVREAKEGAEGICALRKMYSVEKQRQKKKRIEEIPHLEHVLNLLENLEGKAFLETVKEGGF